MDRIPRPPDHYPPAPIPPPPAPTHMHHIPAGTTQPSNTHPHPAHLPQNNRTLPTPHPGGPGQQYPPPPPPPNSYGPPSLPLPNVHIKPERPADHAHPADHSGHATPVARHQPDLLPPQRTPSAPMQPPNGPPMHHSDRPVEGHLHSYGPPLDPHAHHYGPPQHHLIPEHHMGQPMVDHGGYVQHAGGYPPPGYILANVPQQGGPNKKSKANRAAQACDQCRSRKSKCDESRPCTSCADQGLQCNYREGQAAKTDKTNAGAVQDSLSDIKSFLEGLSARMSHIENAVGVTKVETKPLLTSRMDTPAQLEQTDEDSTTVDETDEKLILTSDASAIAALSSIDQAEAASFEEHTTAAHKLIRLWPSINKLLVNYKLSYDYVTEKESRGPLRLYGQGEADESGSNGAFGAASPAYSSGSDETNSPTPPDTWGSGQAMPDGKRSEPFTVGGMGSDGKPDLDAANVNRLFESYKRHIHKLHPFLDINTLTIYMAKFTKSYCTNRTTIHPHSPLILNGVAESGYPKSNKRKRSDPGLEIINQLPRSAPPRSLSNAIVYLVLALGKVCEHKDPLPGTVQEDSRSMMPPPQPVTVSNQGSFGASPLIKQSPSSPHASGYVSTPPVIEGYRSNNRSPRLSFDNSPTMGNKTSLNIEKIPGLFYYREACSILGDFQDSNELGAAQGRLLAGLYKGQLARVQESWSWIADAARTCRYRIRFEGLDKRQRGTPSVYPLGSKEERAENILLLVTWSAIQLESDILAELDYPHSGLLAIESKLRYPANVISEETFPYYEAEAAKKDQVDFYYSAQLFLRQRLNRMHANLYGQALSTQPPDKLVEILFENESLLESWRAISCKFTQWSEDEPGSQDILAARLRAKYYGARYIATRPYLDYALHVMPRIKDGRSRLEDIAVDAKGHLRASALALFRAIATLNEHDIKSRARKCVLSAIKSTTSLDEAGKDRLVVTNIMGTAHAQFGNMLVLSATYMSNIDWLRDLVPRSTVESLLIRTIVFLRRLRYISKTALEDIEILQTIGKYMFGHGFSSFNFEPHSVTASFCSG